MKSNKPIKFSSPADEYGCFSNFSKHKVDYNGRIWKTSEHAFQAQKFPDNPEIQNEIFCALTPSKATEIGRDKKNPLRKDWEVVKVHIMYKIVKAKFSQHPDLYKILLSTHGRKIIEHTYKDKFWGDGGNGKGLNVLGVILVKIREEFETDEFVKILTKER